MTGRDVFLRGRGAEVGVRAPGWMVRLCGATVAVGVVAVADLLGVWGTLGMPRWMLHVLALGGGALLGPTAWGALLWLANGLLVAGLMLVMFTPIVRPMVSRFVRADAEGAAPVDAVVVLSGGLTDDGRITGQALDRLLSGVSLAKRRAIVELALSVVVQEDRHPPASSEADQRALVALMAPELSLRLVRDVHSTRDEALAFAALARTHGWRRVAVVTSPMHTHRACAALETVGIAVECRPAESRDYSLNALNRSENRRLAFQDVLYEIAATLLYRVRGWG
ncbi:MAG: YdcF family protein [Gemmatimonadaceae bacterium]|nr:YdcF family protein [Gemmatimonadaceae bacterium]